MLPRRIALGFAQHGLELGKDLFGRIEVWTIGRQKDHPGTDGTNGLACHVTLVAAEIVEHDDIAGLERGTRNCST